MSDRDATAPSSEPGAAHGRRVEGPSIAQAGAISQEPDWNAAEDFGMLPRPRTFYDCDRFGDLGRRG